MTRKDQLKTIIVDNQARVLPSIWQRTLQIPLESGKIITLSGVRRSGKTHHLFHLIKQLKDRGIDQRAILYINFEDERLRLTTDELDLILQTYQELYPDLSLANCYFFFDEIQEIEGWEKFVARIYASISQNVFITGSNAKLLSKEIATALRGRTITFEVYPLSFAEYINVISPHLDSHKSSDQAILLNLFKQFMHHGGFPETIGQADELREKILQEYFNTMVFRDLIERYQISQTAMLKYFCKRVIGASGGEWSVNKVYNELKSQNYQISKDTLYSYQEYVDTIYLNRFVSKYSHSVVKTENSQKKTYVIDQGLGVALDYKLGRDDGRLLETSVALELFKQGKNIVYQQNGSECDFVILEKDKSTQAIQVTLDLSDGKTRKRETAGLTQTCAKLGLTRGVILTLDQTEDFIQDGIQISVLPAWQYFL